MPFSAKIYAALLAGGSNSRYGGMPKGTLPLPYSPSEETVAERLVKHFKKIEAKEIVISANDNSYDYLPYRKIKDLRSDAGALGGIEAVLHHYEKIIPPKDKDDSIVLFAPCDMPAFSYAEMKQICSRAIKKNNIVAARTPLLLHPLCVAIYLKDKPEISAALDGGLRKVKKLWDILGVEYLQFDNEAAFFNINTPEEYEKWKSSKL